jgi:hypothetical protein
VKKIGLRWEGLSTEMLPGCIPSYEVARYLTPDVLCAQLRRTDINWKKGWTTFTSHGWDPFGGGYQELVTQPSYIDTVQEFLNIGVPVLSRHMPDPLPDTISVIPTLQDVYYAENRNMIDLPDLTTVFNCYEERGDRPNVDTIIVCRTSFDYYFIFTIVRSSYSKFYNGYWISHKIRYFAQWSQIVDLSSQSLNADNRIELIHRMRNAKATGFISPYSYTNGCRLYDLEIIVSK